MIGTGYFECKNFYLFVGNHESFPDRLFTAHNVPESMWTSRWLYTFMASTNVWRKWLPQQDPKLLDDIETMASYSILVKPGFRVISFNTNYCNKDNIWNYLNLTDPNGILNWLVNELQNAENNHELVHIIGHVPPADVCIRVC